MTAWILAATLAAPLAAESIDSVEKAAADWARVRAETVRLETEWKSRRGLLESSLVALKERVQFLEGRRDALNAKHAADRRAAADLAAENQAAAATMRDVTARLEQTGARLLQLRPWLPPRLSQAIEMSCRTLADPATSPGDRTQLIVKVLHRCAQFNRTITLADEVIALGGDNQPRMLEVLYWGLSHGYALDRVNQRAYRGFPGAQGWQWEPLPGPVEPIAELIAIHKDAADPSFVEVPAGVAAFPAEPKP